MSARLLEKQIRDAARAGGIGRVKKAVVAIGEASGESRQDLEHILSGHLGIGQLEFVTERPVLECSSCGRRITGAPESQACPGCGSVRLEIFAGMTVRVISVE